MRLPALIIAATLLLAAAPARAQEALPPEVAARVNATLNDAGTDRRSGDTRIAATEVLTGSLAVVEGNLELAGRVDGDVVVLNGALTLQAGARVGGRVVVVGGGVQQAPGSRVSGEIATFADPAAYCQMGVRIDVSADGCRTPRTAAASSARVGTVDEDGAAADSVVLEEAGVDAGAGRRDTVGWVIAAGRSYNRVEGLTLGLGGRYRRGGTNPTRLRAVIITRSEEGPQLGPERWGYDLRGEQFVGGTQRVRLGARAFSVIDPIEDWHLTDVENSLAALFLHSDFRDHYERQGWSAFAGWGRDGGPVRATLEYRSERHRPVATGSPFTLYKNAEPWRPQPLAAAGHLKTLVASAVVDTRSESWDPSAGWLVRGSVEQTLSSTLRVDQTLAASDASDIPDAVDYEKGWTAATLDIRRYNRISPSSRLNLRLAAGGTLTGLPLPAQRQHAMGGEGSLPGFGLFELDCGARQSTVQRGTGDDARTWYLRYGCSRFLTLQAEWRGDLAFGVNYRGDGDQTGEAGADEEWSARGLPSFAADLGWALFVDLGAGWSREASYRDEDTAIDVGAGITFGDFGVYAAIPVREKYGRGGVNVFVRLAPRF
jgi:hypothetical protein